MHLSTKQRLMNKTFTVLVNKHCSSHNDVEQDQSNCIMENISQLPTTSNNNRFSTFTKYEDIPISRCSHKTSITNATVEPSLDETELSDLLIFTNPNRVLTESMQVVISRHPSLQDLKYINDVSSILVGPPLYIQDKEEPIYQELIRIDHLISTPPMDLLNDIDENKENRPPLMPIKCPVSRIPIWSPSPNNKPMDISENKKHEEVKKKMTTTKPCLTVK